jgi:hypothetical protein
MLDDAGGDRILEHSVLIYHDMGADPALPHSLARSRLFNLLQIASPPPELADIRCIRYRVALA